MFKNKMLQVSKIISTMGRLNFISKEVMLSLDWTGLSVNHNPTIMSIYHGLLRHVFKMEVSKHFLEKKEKLIKINWRCVPADLQLYQRCTQPSFFSQKFCLQHQNLNFYFLTFIDGWLISV